ncbi:MAG: putative sporulation-specific glycosylase YdhD [Candidatus Marinimicrobia bacterium]|nr:putative sporulation-specific glycosylase YdhD [Candidatus Neomarinimicrobiota bacterium]
MHEYWRGGYDMKALADIGDYISLMAYAQHTRFTTPGPVAGFPWVKSLVKFALDHGVPAKKLSLGIPFYSYHWFPQYTDEGGRVWADGLSYQEVAGLLERHEAELTWLPEQKVHTAFWDNDGLFEYLYIEDRRSLEAKLDLLEEYDLRGISVWRLGQEDPAMWEAIDDRLTPVR